jgi:hypothetical protein
MAQQPRWTLLVLALAAACTFCGAPEAKDKAEKSSSPAASGSSEVAAKVGDREITLAQVDEILKQRNQKAYQAYYDARKQILDQMITEELVAAEAEAQGKSVQDLQADVVKDQPAITDEQVNAFYEQNKSRMGGRTLEQLSEQIRNHLVSQQNQGVLVTWINGLKQKAGVKVFLEPPRMDVKIAANDPSKGPEGAPILLVEYSDFQ